MANFYLIAYDPAKTDTVSLNEFIKNNPKFINWWHYIKSMYLIKTNDNLAGVHQELLKQWPKNRYLVIKVDPTYRNGWLNPEAWKWFQKNVD